jgi:hypothetical protein
MAKPSRAPTRAGKTTRARTTKRTTTRKPPSPPSPRRYVYTEELLANGRHRYEHSDEPVTSIAADFGCHKTTFQRMANREHWVRYTAPPRGLPRAAQILAQVEELEAGALSLPPRSGGEGRPPELAQQAQAGGVGGLAHSEAPPTPDPSPPLAARAGGGENKTEAIDTPPPAEVVARFTRAVLSELSAVEAMREQLQRRPQRPRDALETARTLTILTETLQKLERLQAGAPQPGYDDDDFPTDIDAFRDQLARKIESFLASRADAGDAG